MSAELKYVPVDPPVADFEVPGTWQSMGLPGIIDLHTHFLPPRMQRRVWQHFDEAGPLIGREWPIRYRWPDEARAAHLRSMGVRAFTSLPYAHRPGMAADLTEWAIDFARTTPGCLPCGTFYPEAEAESYVTAAIERGARIFKVHLQVGQFDPRDAMLDRVWGLLAESRVPVVIHAGSGPVPAGFTGPGPFGEVLARHPGLTAIIAHMGAPEYEGFLDLAEQHPRTYLDTTMAFTDFFEEVAPTSAETRKRIRDLGGRILFGSDFPTIPYPYAHQIDALVRLDLGDDWLRGVLWQNAANLLALP